MRIRQLTGPRSLWLAAGTALLLVSGCATRTQPTLITAQVPPGTPPASLTSDITVDSFKCPSALSSDNCPTLMGNVVTSGIAATAVEIRDSAQNGPVIASLQKTGTDVWSIPSGTTLTRAQYDDYSAGRLMVDVHDANGPRVFHAPLKP